ncbi:MAG TPA: hypothetical protein VMU04_12420 [Candidatus Acidoferrum sp.]|nr:hypothetical protein [Candidatus Acidoferrum sp.]
MKIQFSLTRAGFRIGGHTAGRSQSILLLVAGVGLAVARLRAETTQVVALGYNMGDPPPLTNAVAVGVIGYSLAALRADGSVAEWGNLAGDPGVSNVVAITTGWSHGFGFRADGTLVGWGDDYGGGISGAPADLTNALWVAVGAYNALAIRADGTVIGWGDNSYGLLNVPEGLSDVVALSVGGFGEDALALRADGTVWEWDASVTNTHPDLSNVVAVASANPYRGAVLHFDGTVTTWPADAPEPLTNIVAIAGGGDHQLAVRSDGTVIAWGCDCHGSTTLPPDLTNVTAVAAGGSDGYDYSIFLVRGTNAPPVLSLSRRNGVPQVNVAGEPFHHYVLEESAAMGPTPIWSFKQNLALSASARTTVSLPADEGARFYRARLLR